MAALRTPILVLVALLAHGAPSPAESDPPPPVAPGPAPVPAPAPVPTPGPVPAPEPLPSNPGPVATEPRIERDVVYGNVAGLDLLLDVARPTSGKGPFPAVLCLHGGGWQKGSKATGSARILSLARAGFVAASADYRLAPRFPFPAAVEDASCAVRFLRSQGEAWNVNPHRVGAWGEGEGGYLALMVGLLSERDGFDATGGHLEHRRSVAAVVAFYALSDLATWSAQPGAQPFLKQAYGKGSAGLLADFLGTPNPKPDHLTRASPIAYVGGGDAAVLSVHGSRDPVVSVEQPKALHAALRRAGTPERLVVVDGAAHDLAGVEREQADAEAVAFLTLHLRGEGVARTAAPAATEATGTPSIERDLVYATRGGVQLRLDLARPRGAGPFPAVVAFHPGPYTPRARADLHEEIAWLAANGFVAASVQYRGPVEGAYPVPVEDGREAIRFLRREAARFRVDPGRIAVSGANLGGWVALHLALASPPDAAARVGAAVVRYAATDLADAAFDKNPVVGRLREALTGSVSPTRPAVERASPLTYAGAGDPPLLLFHNPADKAVPYGQSERLFLRLRAAGVPVVLEPLSGSGHGADRVPQTSADVVDRDRIRARTLEFLGTSLRASNPK